MFHEQRAENEDRCKAPHIQNCINNKLWMSTWIIDFQLWKNTSCKSKSGWYGYDCHTCAKISNTTVPTSSSVSILHLLYIRKNAGWSD